MYTKFTSKNTSKKLSQQVKQILADKGYSFLFNWSDYTHFKTQCSKAFNKAQSIAELFIQETEAKSDYNEYTF